jgi:hypothetical protein
MRHPQENIGKSEDLKGSFASSILISLAGQDSKEKAPRRALLFNADCDLVAIATHDPEEGQEVGEDVVYV